MKRMLLMALFILLLFSGCAQNYINDSDGQIPLSQETPLYQDGAYFATYSHHDNTGYRGEMHLTIREGIITQVEYREVSLSGKDKLSDLEYYEAFKAEHNVDLSVLYTRLYNSVIRNQGTGNLPTLGDFPEIGNSFRFLCGIILNAAVDGNTEPIVLPMNDTYVLTGEADSDGYVPTLKVTYVSNSIVSVSYSMAHPTNAPKESQIDVLAAYRNITGLELNEVYNEYASQILQNNSLDPVDGIAGATQTKTEINRLLEELEQRRQAY